MKAYGDVDVELHPFSNSALRGGEWLPSCLYRLAPGGKKPQ